MASKTVMIRLPEKVAEEVKKLADEKYIGISTMSRILICDYLNEKKIFTRK